MAGVARRPAPHLRGRNCDDRQPADLHGSFAIVAGPPRLNHLRLPPPPVGTSRDDHYDAQRLDEGPPFKRGAFRGS